MGLRIRYSRELRPLGTGGALRLAEPLLDESFLVIYGDSYLRIDYAAVGVLLARSAAVMAVYSDPFGETQVQPNVGLDRNGAVLRYDKRGAGDPELGYIEAGVLALRRTVLNLIPPSVVVSLEEDVFPILIERRELWAFPTTQRFYDIGTPERLQAIEAYLA